MEDVPSVILGITLVGTLAESAATEMEEHSVNILFIL